MTLVPDQMTVTIEHVPTMTRNSSKMSLSTYKKYHKMSRPISRDKNNEQPFSLPDIRGSQGASMLSPRNKFPSPDAVGFEDS